MGTAPADIETPYAVIAGAGLPLGPLSELARWVEAAAHAGAESPAATAAVERALAALRAAWPELEPGDRGLLGELVNDLVARRPGPGSPGRHPRESRWRPPSRSSACGACAPARTGRSRPGSRAATRWW